MKNKFLSQFDADNLGKTVTYYVIAISLIAISLLVGLTDNFLTITMLICGIVLFIYTLLHPWENPKYYAIMGGISLIFLIFEFIIGPDILVKMHLKGDLDEIIAMTVGFIFFAGIIAGIIGVFRFRKYD